MNTVIIALIVVVIYLISQNMPKKEDFIGPSRDMKADMKTEKKVVNVLPTYINDNKKTEKRRSDYI